MPEQYRFALFQPHDNYHKEMYGIGFTSELWRDRSNIHGIGYDREINLKEWEKESGIKAAFIQEIIYHHSAYALTEPTTTIRKNPFYRWLVKKENKLYFDYLIFAKENENYYEIAIDPWEEDKMEDQSSDLFHLDSLLEHRFMQHPFIGTRFHFIQLRTLFYLGNKSEVVSLYEKIFQNSPATSIIDYWAAYYAGVSYLRMEEKEKGAVLLAKSFLHSADKRIAAMEKITRDDLRQILQNNFSPSDKFGLQCMLLAKDPYLNSGLLRQVLEFDPIHPVAELLTTREINKLEDLLLTTPISGYASFGSDIRNGYNWGEKKEEDQKEEARFINREFEQTLSTINSLCKKDHSVFYDIAQIHLHAVGNRPQKISRLSAKKIPKELQLQADLSMWFAASRNSVNSEEMMEQLFPLITKMEKDERESYSPGIFERSLAWMYNHAHENRNKALAALILHQIEENYHIIFEKSVSIPLYGAMVHTYLYQEMNADDAKKLADFIDDDRLATKSIQWLCREIKKEKENVYQLKDWCGTVVLRDKKMELALKIWKGIPQRHWKEYPYTEYLDANPFSAHSGNMHKTIKKVNFTKPEIAKKLLLYDSLYTYGSPEEQLNALKRKAAYAYNTTYFGNSWIMNRAWWSDGDEPMMNNEAGKNYYGCYEAKSLYLELLKKSKDPEEKAHALSMLARCHKNEVIWKSYDPRAYYHEREEKDYTENNPWVQQLERDYSQTAYVRNLFSSCGGREEYWWWFNRIEY